MTADQHYCLVAMNKLGVLRTYLGDKTDNVYVADALQFLREFLQVALQELPPPPTVTTEGQP